MIKAKPFIKWVGGKTQLIDQIEALMPWNFGSWNQATYVEPFVGGGAMLFYVLQKYPNISRAVINDINPDLTTCYRVVRDMPAQLIEALKTIEAEYYAIATEEARKEYYLAKRDLYNTKALNAVDNTSLFLLLNRTCFNGLYRVNKSGKFNVPFGKYDKPTICDEQTIMADSRVLQKVEILNGDFAATLDYAGPNALYYFDPPYRPLSNTSSFNDYAKEAFNDLSQIRLKEYCDAIAQKGATFMLSNSDCMGKDANDRFFDDLYSAYSIERVWASRSVNSVASKRGKLTEILVRNYNENRQLSLEL